MAADREDTESAEIDTGLEDSKLVAELRKVEKRILTLTRQKKAIPRDLEILNLRLQAALAPPEKKAAFSLQVAKLLEVKKENAAGFSLEDIHDSVLQKIAGMEKSRVGYTPKAMGYV